MARGSCTFGIVRSIEATRGRTRLAELCEILSRELGTLFVPHHAETYAALADATERGEVGLAWLPPLACVRIEDASAGAVLALPVRRGVVSYRAALIASSLRPDAPQTLKDIAGRRVAWVDRESSSGYHVPRLFLEGAGMATARFFADERFVGSHSNVVAAVVSGAVDVGATYCALAASPSDSGPHAVPSPTFSPSLPQGPWTTSSTGALPVRILATTGAIPNDALVASNRMPTEARLALTRWVLALSGSRAQKLSADLFGAESFRVAEPAHFEPLRRLVAVARTRSIRPPS